MNIHNQEHQQRSERTPNHVALVTPLGGLDRTLLPIVGGKAANLGELIRGGFSVPPGFCVTTAVYALVSMSAGLEPILAELSTTRAEETLRLAELATAARAALQHAPVPESCIESITEAYQALGTGDLIPVAVRSSATAEDLPYASFAGQQETYLNIVGIEAVLAAVQRVFASLWTDRAVSYRASLGIDPHAVRLAVVVQRMVDARVAGVLFTANPLTGKRRQAVIDANPGLGEAVVSGATNPDHFLVNTTTGEIVERRMGDKRVVIQATHGGGTQRVERPEQSTASCLSDAQIRTLAELGAKVEAHYEEPQDIEWAIDGSEEIFLLQARPVTTLFPLPADVPLADEVLRVYLSFNIQQGTYRPFTPMGISATRLLVSSIATIAGIPPRDSLQGHRFVTEAASRVFIDVTAALRSSFGRTFLMRAMSEAEVHAAAIFQQLVTDKRLSLLPPRRWPFFRAMILLLVRTRLPWYLMLALLSPRAGEARLLRFVRTLRATGEVEAGATAAERLAAVQQLLFDVPPRLLSSASPVMLAGMQTFALAERLLGDLARVGELQTVLRGAPSNPTSEMNRALWLISEQARADPATARLVRDTPSARLAEDYDTGSLPSRFQQGLADFLATYGHRSVAELDLGVPRWSEDPTYLLEILANYQKIRDPAQAPDALFQRAAEEAEAMVAELTRRAKRVSWLRGLLVGFCLSRARALGGQREMPRFCLTLLLARARALLWPVGEVLAQTSRLEAAGDIFFITLPEARAALAGTDLRTVVRERRASYDQELGRRRVPLVLLSDGTEPTVEAHAAGARSSTLTGTPASPGIVTSVARVILDPTNAHIEQGEILVAPSTDPGWTPLFLTAGGLVMEMGGAMAHGAIVAREYGLPAVVGVPGATERICTGSRITVDGSAGTVVIEQSIDV
jgi:rifampicin phosphotransferase